MKPPQYALWDEATSVPNLKNEAVKSSVAVPEYSRSFGLRGVDKILVEVVNDGVGCQ